MSRELLEILHKYFLSIYEKSEEEANILRQIEERLEFFPITHVSRDDLKSKGFDVSGVSDADMENLAQKMCEDYLTQLFWESMVILAVDGIEIPRKEKCPLCVEYDIDDVTEIGSYSCNHCGARWRDRYVLVEFPEDASGFERCDIGYPSFNCEDNGARYVREYDYLYSFNKYPKDNKYFTPVVWPESQKFMELPDNLRELCEDIETGKAFEDFGSSAIWVPLCLLNSKEL